VSADLRAAYAGSRALVTGGVGFIGSQLARRLVGLGARVTVIDAFLPGCGANCFNVRDLRDRIQLLSADLCDPDAIASCVPGQDYVFNLAGRVSHVDSVTDPEGDLESNCRAHLSLLEGCRRLNPGARVVFTSSRQVYGRPRYVPVDEAHPCQPVDVNGVHKWAAERYHQLYHEIHGIACVCLRLSNTYGPGQLVRHPRQGFMGWFLRRVVEGGEIEIMGDGTQLRDLNYVDDVADALLLAGSSPAAPGQLFNLGAPEPVSLLALVQEMIGIAGRGSYRFVPFPEERARIDVGSVSLDFGRIGRELGWTPRTPLREGLARSIAFYTEHLTHYLEDQPESLAQRVAES
jgi:UDP-glucose 4-epimerase